MRSGIPKAINLTNQLSTSYDSLIVKELVCVDLKRETSQVRTAGEWMQAGIKNARRTTFSRVRVKGG